MEVEMDTEVEEPPDHSTKKSAFEYFSRKMKAETKRLFPNMRPHITDEVLNEQIFIKWKQVSSEVRARR